MAFFKQRVSPEQYGAEVLITAKDWLETDLMNALGRCFPKLDVSNGWIAFFEGVGVSKEMLKTYLRMGMHCSLQSCFTQCDPILRHRIVSGAIGLLEGQAEGYEFETCYDKLARALEGERVFGDKVDSLSASFPLHFLPEKYEDAAISASKMLVDEFASKQLPNPEYIFDNFKSFSSGIGASISLVQRAHNNASRDLKI